MWRLTQGGGLGGLALGIIMPPLAGLRRPHMNGGRRREIGPLPQKSV